MPDPRSVGRVKCVLKPDRLSRRTYIHVSQVANNSHLSFEGGIVIRSVRMSKGHVGQFFWSEKARAEAVTKLRGDINVGFNTSDN